LRPSAARYSRQRGSARGEMQKSSARKLHFEPHFTSLDHLVGEGEQCGGKRKRQSRQSISCAEFAVLQGGASALLLPWDQTRRAPIRLGEREDHLIQPFVLM